MKRLVMLLVLAGAYAQCEINMSDNSRTIDLAGLECCHGLLFYDSGGPQLSSSAYYGPNENRTYTFLAPPGQRIRVEFVPTAAYRIDSRDTLFLYDGNSTSAPLIRRIVGTSTTPPTSFVTTGNAFTVRFVSDASLESYGWGMRISCQAQASCSFNMSSNTIDLNAQGCCGGANFYDSGGPDGFYSSGFRGTFTVRAAPGQRIEVIFSYSLLGSGSNKDTLRIYDGPNTSSPLLGAYTEDQLPPRITSTGNALTFDLRDLNNSGSTGWAAWLRCIGQVSTALDLAGAQSLVLYPNPSASGAILQAGGVIRRAIIRDVTGRMVQEMEAQGAQLSIPSLPAGLYLIEVELEGGVRHHLRWVAE